jgi:ATP adenylyltransferase
MNDCTLCAELATRSSRASWNQPLIETKNFVVLPSLGALVEGWLLILPKRHVISMGALPIHLREEAEELERSTRTLLKARYGRRIVAFEHGPSAAKHGTGCGVDHAHLHVLPLNCDLLSYTRPFIPTDLEWEPCGWAERSDAYSKGLDYLYLGQEGPRGLLAVSTDFGSQVFRKAIASYLGIVDQFSWRTYPQLETVAKTMQAISAALSASTGSWSHDVS